MISPGDNTEVHRCFERSQMMNRILRCVDIPVESANWKTQRMTVLIGKNAVKSSVKILPRAESWKSAHSKITIIQNQRVGNQQTRRLPLFRIRELEISRLEDYHYSESESWKSADSKITIIQNQRVGNQQTRRLPLFRIRELEISRLEDYHYSESESWKSADSKITIIQNQRVGNQQNRRLPLQRGWK